MGKHLLSLLGLTVGTCLNLFAFSSTELGFAQAYVNPSDVVSSSARTTNSRQRAQVLNSKIHSNKVAQLVESNNKFGFKLFLELYKQQPDQNIFISPSSISLVLTMAYNGANGRTQQAIAKTLELQGVSLEDISHTNADLRTTLKILDPEV